MPIGPPADGRVRAFVGIGANLGDPEAAVLAAIGRMKPLGLVRASSLYRSAPIDAGGPDFVNAVVALDTPLEPEALLDALQVIELDFGRERPYHHAPRTLDLDLLLHGDALRDTPRLRLPHPRLHLRAFVLRPLLELEPSLQLPGLGHLSDQLVNTAEQVIVALTRPPTMTL